MAMVFDKNGEQIPEYQGPFEETKEKIYKNALFSAVIFGPKSIHLLKAITR